MNKFRVYDKLRKEYLSGGQVFIAIQPGQRPKDPVIYLDTIEDPDMFKDRFIFEQYTGKKDKRGEEIYEGDIITNLYGDIGVIVWKEKITSFVCSLNLVSFNSVNWDKCVIIGNIHDNPDLLEVA